MYEGYPPIQEASILTIRLCLSIKYKSVASIMSTSIMNPLSLTYHICYQCNIMYALETKTRTEQNRNSKEPSRLTKNGRPKKKISE